MWIRQLKAESPKSVHNKNDNDLVKKIGLNIQNDSLSLLRNIEIITKMHFFLVILVQKALIVSQFWTIKKITPKPALLSLTNL